MKNKKLSGTKDLFSQTRHPKPAQLNSNRNLKYSHNSLGNILGQVLKAPHDQRLNFRETLKDFSIWKRLIMTQSIFSLIDIPVPGGVHFRSIFEAISNDPALEALCIFDQPPISDYISESMKDVLDLATNQLSIFCWQFSLLRASSGCNVCGGRSYYVFRRSVLSRLSIPRYL